MKNDFKISGAGSVGGGDYNDIKISGSGKILGDITGESLKISGAGKALGNVIVKLITISGAFTCQNNIESNHLKVSGAVSIKGNLVAESADISGSISIDQEANVDKFHLNSNTSTIHALHGDTITIEAPNRWFVKRKRNTIHEIEATDINISYVEAKRVSGDIVVIGPECIINTVEYKDTIKVDRSSKIDTITKLS